jgi:2-keto-4-pentenoate hydratase/2-oxohepta-3-ene-1,7-dioic acid hydratase in catechol pathway
MKIAQFEYQGAPFIGVQSRFGTRAERVSAESRILVPTDPDFIGMSERDWGNRWINYTKAAAAYSMIEHNRFSDPVASLEEFIRSGGLNLEEMNRVGKFIARHRLEQRVAIDKKAILKAPIARPHKIVALGLNYALHAREGNFQLPKEPILFVKVGSSVIGPNEPVRIPRGLGRIDHEVELAVIIGKKATEVKKRDASRYIAGYTIANDVSARDLQSKDLEKKHPWFRSKSFDTFTPLGPWIVTADEIKPPVHLNLECRVNGKIRQKSNTRDMVFDIPTQIEFISRYITLEPGDIISTGTPEGIGPITHGDTIVCRIEGIGELKNPVRFR